MNTTCLKFVCGLSVIISLISCKQDDNGGDYVPINIIAVADSGEVFQNTTIDIAIFANDSNVPSSGQLSVENPQSGSIAIINNGTASLLDDVVRYTPDATFTGEVSFQYTVCDSVGESCATGTVSITVLPFSPVVFDLSQVPYEKLSDYNFFDGSLADQQPVYGVLPYEPITPLFTDYAHKKRFVWMPYGAKAEYVGDGDLINFPESGVLIKSFYYENVQPGNTTRIIETRLLYKKDGGWSFADYIWNEDQSEALLDTTGDGGFVPIEWIENGETKTVNYRIPASSECFTCHKRFGETAPIGVKPQNLNSIYNFEDGAVNQLSKWIEMGYLESNVPTDIVTVAKWDDPTASLNDRARSYLDINCASCHSDSGHCDYRSLRFDFSLTENTDNLGICIDPDTPVPGYEGDKIITPGDPENSVLFFRFSTNEEQYRMPLLGRTIQHEEGVALIEEWINSLTQTCN